MTMAAPSAKMLRMRLQVPEHPGLVKAILLDGTQIGLALPAPLRLGRGWGSYVNLPRATLSVKARSIERMLDRLAAKLQATIRAGLWTPPPPPFAEHQILHGALGLAYNQVPFRRHFCAPADGPTRDLCEELATRGVLLKLPPPFPSGTQTFLVTELGAARIGHKLPSR